MKNGLYTMKEVCDNVGMTYETLKFYCNKGLVPNIKRNENNHRVFDENDLKWISSLSCLKKCGMSIKEMLEYLELCLEGQSSIPSRQNILEKKREALVEQIKELEKSVAYIDWKQNFYNDVLTGKTKYYSNLIRVDN